MEGVRIPKFQNYHAGCNRTHRAEGCVTEMCGQEHQVGFLMLVRDPSTEVKGGLLRLGYTCESPRGAQCL